MQIVLFGFFSFAGTYIFWKFFRVKPAENQSRTLNNRMAQLMGTKVSLLQAITAGRGKVQIQDALWSVQCEEDLPQGALVEVIDSKDGVLIVKKV